MRRPLVVDVEDLAPGARRWLAERAEVVEAGPHDGEAFRAALARAEGIVVRTYTVVDEELLAQAPRLKVVGRAGVGLDNVDVTACRARGIAVVYTPEANASTVAELVFALLLDHLRPRTQLIAAPTMEQWTRLRFDLMGERELRGLNLGVWGMGRVGRRVARLGHAFGMEMRFNDLLTVPEDLREGAERVDPGTLVASADVLSLHVDGRPENRHLVDASVLSRLKPNAILVNASRGFVVDTSSLASWLVENPEATALLDVHDPEPIPPDSPLFGLPNAVLVPHLGSATIPAKDRMGRVVEDVWRVLSGEEPRWPAPAT